MRNLDDEVFRLLAYYYLWYSEILLPFFFVTYTFCYNFLSSLPYYIGQRFVVLHSFKEGLSFLRRKPKQKVYKYKYILRYAYHVSSVTVSLVCEVNYFVCI